MIFGLDYDGTYTEDPDLWDQFIELAQKRRHRVVIVTMRYNHEVTPALLAYKELGVSVIYTGRKAKMDYVLEHHKVLMPDVWIDDNPQWVHNDAI